MMPASTEPLTASIVAVGLVLVLAGVTAALVFLTIPKGNEQPILLLIGSLTANVGAVVGYFFGASVKRTNHPDDKS